MSLASKGCFAKLPIPVLSTHEKGTPIGEVVTLRKDDSRVHVIAEIFQNAAADYVWKLIENGEMRGLSVLARTIEESGVVDGIRFVRSWQLMELSVCRQGANDDCRFEMRHAGASR